MKLPQNWATYTNILLNDSNVTAVPLLLTKPIEGLFLCVAC